MKKYRAFFEESVVGPYGPSTAKYEETFKMSPEAHVLDVTHMAHELLKHEGADVLYSEVQWEEVA